MKCPYSKEFDCPFVDTSDMTKEVECPECKYREAIQEEKEQIDEWNEFIL